jgi:hypothetical protein
MNLVTLGKIAKKYAIFCAFFEKRWQAAIQWMPSLFFVLGRHPSNKKMSLEAGSNQKMVVFLFDKISRP